MTTYWDSSSLVKALLGLTAWPASGQAITRAHALAECFSTLTGGRLPQRVEADDAWRLLQALAGRLRLVELTGAETLAALAQARRRGVRGGAVHDYLHAVAAEQHGAARIATENLADFTALTRLPCFSP